MSYLIQFPDLEDDALRARLAKGMVHRKDCEPAWPKELLHLFPICIRETTLSSCTCTFLFPLPLDGEAAATKKESIRDLTPLVVAYAKDGKGLIIGRITLGKYLAHNRFLKASDEIRAMIASGNLKGREQKSAEALIYETRDLINARDTATLPRKGISVDYRYRNVQTLEKALEKILQLERIANIKPTL